MFKEQFVFQAATRRAEPENAASTAHASVRGVYTGHGHKLQFLAVTFINSYKYDSCCFFFLLAFQGMENEII